MGKLVVVKDDKVEGTDKHNISGAATTPNTPYTGVGDYDYFGKMTGQLCDFVNIDGKPVALVTSKSSLNLGEDIPMVGKHSAGTGKNFNPPSPPPDPMKINILDPIGTGNPSAGSGSSFVNINATNVLLDGNKIDTCDGLGSTGNSTVTAENQNFVSCAE
jgi:hypothetical protein